MLRSISCFLIFMTVYLHSFAMMTDQHQQSIGYEKLFNQDNTITSEFKALFEVLSVPIMPNNLEEAFNLVQGKFDKTYTWLRTGERYDTQTHIFITNEQADEVIRFSQSLGFFDDINIHETINGILIMGSTLARMRAQVHVLNHSIEKSPDLGKLPVYFVGGERVLSQEVGETQENLYNPKDKAEIFNGNYIPEEKQPEITDERDMIELVVKQSLSNKFKNIVFVMAPKKEGNARATTMDGMELWFSKHNPSAGKYAIVSSNPFILYQQLVATDASLTYKTPNVSFTGYGSAINLEFYVKEKGKSYTAQILLDNFARIIYEIRKINSLKACGAEK